MHLVCIKRNYSKYIISVKDQKCFNPDPTVNFYSYSYPRHGTVPVPYEYVVHPCLFLHHFYFKPPDKGSDPAKSKRLLRIRALDSGYHIMDTNFVFNLYLYSICI